MVDDFWQLKKYIYFLISGLQNVTENAVFKVHPIACSRRAWPVVSISNNYNLFKYAKKGSNSQVLKAIATFMKPLGKRRAYSAPFELLNMD